MDNNIFINESLTYAIKEYMSSKSSLGGIKYNSFFVVVIRLLSIIYDELDIIGPYQSNNAKLLYENLEKYDYSKEAIDEFLTNLQNYYKSADENNFINIQTSLVDMYAKKKLSMNVSNEEIKLFRSLLYSPYSSSPLMVSYNFKMTSCPFKVLNYFDDQMIQNVKKVEERAKETLNLDAYKLLNYSSEDIDKMSADELDDVNKMVYNHFEINSNAINKKYLLDKAVYDINHPKPVFSTGNGYVDILFVLSLITTLGMIILLLTLFVL